MKRETLLQSIRIRLAESPAVALLGARQIGKTTLAEQVAAEWDGRVTTFDLERPEARDALRTTPGKLLGELDGLIIIDEVQRLPELFELLRPLCDVKNRKNAFLLLGSASWKLVKDVSETLAGRIQFVDVSGFSLAEVGPEQQDALWLRGGFPRSFLAPDDEARERWLESFCQTFIERDIPGLGVHVSPEALGRFWQMLAHFHGQTWNATELARSMDASPKTATYYRDLLEGTFMIRVLPPWFENLGKRLVKSPKIYLRDSGMLHYRLGISGMLDLRTHPRYGASWEGFALEQTLIAHGGRDAYFYGTQRGAELDLLLLRRGNRWGFEFKRTDAPKITKSMQIALEDLKLAHLWVVYPGNLRYDLGERISALPLHEVFGLTFRKE
ncbi:MAG: ATP-binding protein [Puniceicoccales bacterium]|nr:ATP-binding protein [Puniceicoccales bacterium]